ncbi:expressed unknown protein [Seminavis robusta]|uniref:Uncharacterized protein n=1 Tax=Seminavis robusta TaxID=568900 RepID=A0A9N8HHT7_9STRA|nr:expressed unknown protein [Seminavis robusta]|eukprot:Sro658_g182670.1 n/a (225) ;mRNA; f:11339-12095
MITTSLQLLLLSWLLSLTVIQGHSWRHFAVTNHPLFGVQNGNFRASIGSTVDDEDYERAERAIFQGIQKAERKVLKAMDDKVRVVLDKSTAKAVLSRVLDAEEGDEHLLLQALEAAEQAVILAVEKEVGTIFHALHEDKKPSSQEDSAAVIYSSSKPDKPVSQPMAPSKATPPKTFFFKSPVTKDASVEEKELDPWMEALDKHKRMDEFLQSLDLQGVGGNVGD